jgi:hypothetical protein
MSTIEGLTPLQLRINTLYRLYVRPLNGLAKLRSILSSILSPLLTVSKYEKVTNGKPHLYCVLANSNITLYPLAYVTA